MADLLVIVPTKGRPQLIPRVIAGLERADAPVDLVLVINQEDAADYPAPASSAKVNARRFLVDNALAYPGKLNAAAEAFASSYRYLALWNDDHEALTPGWDTLAKRVLADEPWGLAYGPDGVWEQGEVPTAPILTSSLQTALGWVALPGLHHILVDNVWQDLARWTGTLHFIPEMRIQHHHVDNGEAEADATYALTQHNDARNSEDRVRYTSWFERSRWVDGDRLRGLWEDEATIPPRQFAPWE